MHKEGSQQSLFTSNTCFPCNSHNFLPTEHSGRAEAERLFPDEQPIFNLVKV